MPSVGTYLRGLREKQGMSVDELSRATRVLHHYLEALEGDSILSLPAPVFTKGFIRAYCQAVGVPPEEALKLYDQLGVPVPDVGKVPSGVARVVAPETRRPIVHEPDYLPVTPVGPAAQGEPREKRRGTALISFVLLVVLGGAFFAVTLALQSGRDGGDAEHVAQAPTRDLPAATDNPVAPPVAAPVAVESPAPVPAPAHVARQSPSVATSAPASSAPVFSVSASPAGPATPGAQPMTAAPATPSPPVAPKPQAAPKPPVAPSVAATPSVTATPGTASTASAIAAPPAAAPVTASAPASPAPASTVAARGLGLPYRLIARTTETTWMRVRTEDGRTSEETIPANEIREWISNGPFVLTIGNAGGVSLELNGRPVPRLGASGSVITRMVLPSDNQ